MWPTLIYISGPMSGLPQYNRPAFHAAAQALRQAGYRVCSPAELPLPDGTPWGVCMRACIRAMADCDAVATLPGWTRSRGAPIEVRLAEGLGWPVAPLETWLRSAPAAARAGG